LAVKLFAYIRINRCDLAARTLETMKEVEEDNCLYTLASCWLSLHDPKAPVNVHDTVITQLNELSEKFGYTLKTYNLLAIALIERGDLDKAIMIYENALSSLGVYGLFEKGAEDPEYTKVFQPNNTDLACLLFNYIKANAAKNGLSSEIYAAPQGGMQQFLRGDPLSIKLFSLLSKMQSPLAKEFFEERMRASEAFDLALKKEGL
jgi:tetratricopeptide (TPR) repeat protein